MHSPTWVIILHLIIIHFQNLGIITYNQHIWWLCLEHNIYIYLPPSPPTTSLLCFLLSSFFSFSMPNIVLRFSFIFGWGKQENIWKKLIPREPESLGVRDVQMNRQNVWVLIFWLNAEERSSDSVIMRARCGLQSTADRLLWEMTHPHDREFLCVCLCVCVCVCVCVHT